MNPPILATRNLGLDIGGAKIVADVSLEVAEGELLGIIGPNGAGKTSLFNLLSGLYRPTAGSIHLGGRDITKQPVALRTREGLGRTFQVSSVFPLLSVHENVRLAAEAALGGTLRLWRRAASVNGALERARAAHRARRPRAVRGRAGGRARARRQAAARDRDAARRGQAHPASRRADGRALRRARAAARRADPCGSHGRAQDGADGRAPHRRRHRASRNASPSCTMARFSPATRRPR